jgi:diadenosine tetraphosphatase ApaH/serine/threonine PP2A family protein phosphatase
LAFVGHTHRKMDRDLGRWRVINPGSVGQSFTEPGVAEYVVMTFENGEAKREQRRVPYDLDKFLRDGSAAGYPHPDYLEKRFRQKP